MKKQSIMKWLLMGLLVVCGVLIGGQVARAESSLPEFTGPRLNIYVPRHSELGVDNTPFGDTMSGVPDTTSDMFGSYNLDPDKITKDSTLGEILQDNAIEWNLGINLISGGDLSASAVDLAIDSSDVANQLMPRNIYKNDVDKFFTIYKGYSASLTEFRQMLNQPLKAYKYYQYDEDGVTKTASAANAFTDKNGNKNLAKGYYLVLPQGHKIQYQNNIVISERGKPIITQTITSAYQNDDFLLIDAPDSLTDPSTYAPGTDKLMKGLGEDTSQVIDTDTGTVVKTTEKKLGGVSVYLMPVKLPFDLQTTPDKTDHYAIVAKDQVAKAKIEYRLPDGSEAAPTRELQGSSDQAMTITSPTVADYTPDQKQVKVDFTAKDKTYTVTYHPTATGSTTTGTNTTSTSDSSSSVADELSPITPFKVYGKQALYRYNTPTFKKSQRINRYAKKAKAYAPVFKVVDTAKSANGVLRYKLADGTYITANPDYVAKLYWQGNYQKLYVTNARGIRAHSKAVFAKATDEKHFKQGTAINVVKRVKAGQTTRYELTDGTYITGNKQWVSPTKPRLVRQIKAKKTIKLYRNVNLTHKVKAIKQGKTVKVVGWDYSRQNSQTVSGTLRYHVAGGGYITANPKLVMVEK